MKRFPSRRRLGNRSCRRRGWVRRMGEPRRLARRDQSGCKVRTGEFMMGGCVNTARMSCFS